MYEIDKVFAEFCYVKICVKSCKIVQPKLWQNVVKFRKSKIRSAKFCIPQNVAHFAWNDSKRTTSACFAFANRFKRHVCMFSISLTKRNFARQPSVSLCFILVFRDIHCKNSTALLSHVEMSCFIRIRVVFLLANTTPIRWQKRRFHV
jgi:hypothetical protein